MSALPTNSPGELDTLNELCADTWCEGSFEMVFDGIRCEASRCDVDMRWYSDSKKGAPPPDVSRLEVNATEFRGKVVGLGTFARCTPPCWASGEVKPCAAIDVRCNVDATTVVDQQALSFCIAAMEDAIRKRFPE